MEYIGDRMEEILGDGGVSYVKWDMNRSISDLFSAGRDARYQGTVYHRQILGVYKLYERLTRDFPHVLFESCASGGARFDPGILYYAPQGWVSDDTDGVERVKSSTEPAWYIRSAPWEAMFPPYPTTRPRGMFPWLPGQRQPFWYLWV